MARKILVLFLLFLFSQKSSAQFPGKAEGKKTSLSAGLGTVWVGSIYKGEKDIFIPLPVFIYRYKKCSFNGLGLSCVAYRSGPLDLNVSLDFRFGGFDPSKSEYLEGMRKRKAQLNLGSGADYKVGPAVFYLKASADINNSNNGWEAEFGAGRIFGNMKIFFRPSLKAVYESRDRGNLNYGVYPSEALAARPAYSPGGTLSFGADTALIANGEKSSAFLRLAYKALAEKIKKSPIVDSSFELSVIAAYTWKF